MQKSIVERAIVCLTTTASEYKSEEANFHEV